MIKKMTILLGSMVLIVILSPLCAYAKTNADTIYMEVEFPEPRILPSEYSPEYIHIEMDGTRSLGAIGEPVIPVKGVKILIPPGRKVKDLDIIPGERTILSGIYMIEPGQQEYPLSQVDKIKITPDKPNPKIYKAAVHYPGKLNRLLPLQKKMGYPIHVVNLYPVDYNPKTGTIAYYKKMTLVVRLEADSKLLSEKEMKGVPRLRTSPRIKERDKAIIHRFIDNKEGLGVYEQSLTSLTPQTMPALGAADSTSSLGSQTMPALGAVDPAQQYEYVIITQANFVASFEPLKLRRIQKGLSATIVTTDWIYANYSGTRPDGATDNQTKIRNFIIDAYNNWGTRYVLLGGDGDGASVGGESGNNIIPARGFYASGAGKTDNNIPADLYYACLNGTFDRNANGIYGEQFDGEFGGEVDLLAEVYIGRACVDSAAEANNFVRKTLAYEDSTDSYLTNNYMVGQRLGFGGVSEYATAAMEEIRNGTDIAGFTTKGFLSNPDRALEAETLYDSQYETWSKETLVSLINNGVHILNNLGHGSDGFDMKFTNADANNLTNTKYFIAYSQACYAGSFDNWSSSSVYFNQDCIVEHFTTSYAGAAAYIGNSRFGWGVLNSTSGSSQYYNRHFWDALFSEGITRLGRMNQDSKEDNLPYLNTSMNRWCYFELNLFGDPALEVHVPNVLAVAVAGVNLTEKIGNGNGRIEPGETVALTTMLRALNQDAFNVSLTLSSSDPNVTITQNNAGYGIILKGTSQSNASNTLLFTVSPICPTPVNINFTLTITANGYAKSKKYSLEIDDFRERQITSSSAAQYFAAISQDHIVWQDYRNNISASIYLYDLATSAESPIIADSIGHYSPAISQDRIVWYDSRNGNSDIYLYDLTTNTERQITTNPASQYSPVISGNRIVWQDYRNDPSGNGNYDIYLYDLATSTERPITTNPAAQRSPAISGNLIVWQDERNGNADIYLYDLATSTERPITTNLASQYSPAISGNRIVWTDYRNGNADTYLYELTANTERRINTNVYAQQSPAISGNRIIWQDSRNNNLDIYLYDLGDVTPASTPVVIDQGNYASVKGLSASWSSTDAESGIAEYQYKITQDKTAGTIIKDWTSAGTNTSVIVTGLSLAHGKQYYFSVKAKNGAGLWSAIGYSDGITVDALPTVATLTPSAGSSAAGVPVTFTTTFSDADGTSDIATTYLLINTSISGLNCFYGYYNLNTNKLYLRNDAHTGWIGGYAPGSANIIENSYVKLDCAKTSVQAPTINTLTVKWNITFKLASVVSRNIYLYVADDHNANSGWVKKGTWTVNPPVPAAPTSLTAAFISPSQVKLTWKDNATNESGFKIERATSSAGPFIQIVSTVPANVVSYTDGPLAIFTTYYYRVRAYNKSGDSAYSNTVSVYFAIPR